MSKTLAIVALGPLVAYLLGVYVMADFNVLHWTMDQRGGNALLMVVGLVVSSIGAAVERDTRK